MEKEQLSLETFPSFQFGITAKLKKKKRFCYLNISINNVPQLLKGSSSSGTTISSLSAPIISHLWCFRSKKIFLFSHLFHFQIGKKFNKLHKNGLEKALSICFKRWKLHSNVFFYYVFVCVRAGLSLNCNPRKLLSPFFKLMHFEWSKGKKSSFLLTLNLNVSRLGWFQNWTVKS